MAKQFRLSQFQVTHYHPEHCLNRRIYFSFAQIQEVILPTSMDSVPKAALLSTKQLPKLQPVWNKREEGLGPSSEDPCCKFHMPFLLTFLLIRV